MPVALAWSARPSRLDRVESRDLGQIGRLQGSSLSLVAARRECQRPLLHYNNRSREPATETVPVNPDAGQAAGSYVASSGVAPLRRPGIEPTSAYNRRATPGHIKLASQQEISSLLATVERRAFKQAMF